MSRRFFASDNASGVHPEALAAIARANVGHALAYGRDPDSERARARVREVLGDGVASLLVWGGTAANVIALACVCRPHEAVICARRSHLYRDECGAAERFIGCKLLPAATVDGKITPASLRAELEGVGVVHHSQPRVLSIAQPTEVGTVYTLAELRALTDAARRAGLLVHVDGARLPNAAVALGVGLRETSLELGVDALSLGGTKSGLLGAEAVVFRDPAHATAAGFVQKQAMQLISKMRFVAVQIELLLREPYWRDVAGRANEMAAALAARLTEDDAVTLAYPRETNGVFTRLSPAAVERLADALDPTPLVWERERDASVVRWMCSYDTSLADIEALAACVRDAARRHPTSARGRHRHVSLDM